MPMTDQPQHPGQDAGDSTAPDDEEALDGPGSGDLGPDTARPPPPQAPAPARPSPRRAPSSASRKPPAPMSPSARCVAPRRPARETSPVVPRMSPPPVSGRPPP